MSLGHDLLKQYLHLELKRHDSVQTAHLHIWDFKKPIQFPNGWLRTPQLGRTHLYSNNSAVFNFLSFWICLVFSGRLWINLTLTC